MKKQANWKKRILVILVALVVCFGIAVGCVGNYLVNYAIGRSGDGGNRDVALEVDENATTQVAESKQENQALQDALTEAFLQNVPEQTVSITSSDGLALNGGLFRQEDSHNWAIVIHGYRSNHTWMGDFAQRYYDAGYNVLAPDLRGCGESGGDYIGMGWPDRLDICQWIDWIIQQDPDARIVLHGISMGGATVMMTSGEDLPDNVVCLVEDCGYSSVWDIFSSELKLRFGLPSFPVLNSASMIADIKAGYGFTEASSLKQVAKCEKPMLFIHGDQDDFVPYYMLDMAFDAKPGDNKEKLVATGAGHGNAKDILGEVYWQHVFDFIETHSA